MQCEMCGREVKVLYTAEIEGVKLNVCKECAKHGKILRIYNSTYKKIEKEKKRKEEKEEIPKEEEIEKIVDDYAIRVKKAREKKGWKQEELAKKIAEKESVIHHIESGRHEPPMNVAKKLERVLGIKLIEKAKASILLPERKKETLTLGDIAVIKKRK